MAGALKQAFIEAVRLTPDGIAAFLETPLPEAPIVAAADNTANEALAAFLLDLFRAFAGLTPVELLLRIGQHNNVLESAMIAGLEYIEGADSSEQAVSFTEPAAGQSYAPGEMRFTVAIQNGTPGRVNLTVDDGDPLKMTADEDGKTWVQYQTIVATGAHTAGVSAEFAAGDVQTASVSFTVTDPDSDPPPETPPETPGGEDAEAMDRAVEKFDNAYKQLGSLISAGVTEQADLDAALASVTTAANLVSALVSGRVGYLSLSEQLALAIDAAWEYGSIEGLLLKAAAISTIVHNLAGLY